MTMKVAIYTRVSTKEQAEEGFSLDAQRGVLTKFCLDKGYEVVGIYSDEGISGKNKKRPALQKMLKDSASSKFNLVIVWKYSRIARNLVDTLTIVQELKKNDVSFKCLDIDFDTTTPAGIMLMQMMGSIAEYERNNIVENVVLGMNQRARDGKWNGGILFGYNSINKSIQVNPEEAEVVKQMFTWYLNGVGPVLIRDRLNKLGIKTKKGNEFNTIVVRDILTNPVYKGYIRFGRRREHNKLNESYTLVVGEHQAIIDEETFEKAQIVMQSNKRKTKRGTSGVHLLTSILRCPDCGAKMYFHPASAPKPDGTYRGYYMCSRYKQNGTCKARTINAEKTERAVIERLAHFIASQEIVKGVVNELNNNGTMDLSLVKKQLETILREIRELEKGKHKQMLDYSMGKIDVDSFKEIKQFTEKVIKERVEQREALEKELVKSVNNTVNYNAVHNALKKFQTMFQKADMKLKKRLLDSLIEKITLNEDRTIKHIEFRFELPNNNGPDDVESNDVVTSHGTLNRIISRAKAEI
ncbi:recombinase family protein [Cohnella faecalis]|uniref:Recombinase family protein n=1 Tax=Cohnella faecalis TaxID=2315694 RepID=A0A398CKY2_9BACL|nr:recombinase family protein [Cohnella faecalis]RIE01558.1 recombinase family protein [Cohnella faecalis]